MLENKTTHKVSVVIIYAFLAISITNRLFQYCPDNYLFILRVAVFPFVLFLGIKYLVEYFNKKK